MSFFNNTAISCQLEIETLIKEALPDAEVKIQLFNNGGKSVSINPGDEVAQIIFKETPEVNLVEVDELDNTKRGSGGFGSTGVWEINFV